MKLYLQHHKWLAAFALVAAIALMAACGGGTKQASQKAASTAAASAAYDGTTDRSAFSGVTVAESAPGDSATLQKAAPAGAAEGGAAPGSNGPNPLPSLLDRKIIMTATLNITSDEVSKRFEDVGNIAAGAGGFIASSQFGTSGDRQTASVTIRVPGTAYQRVLVELRKLGEVKGEQSGANDITEEYTDLQSRLRNLTATEEQYVQFLLRAQNINEVLTVQDRLNITRAEIEQVQGRINLLDHQTDLATITVHLDPPPPVTKTEPKPNGDRNPLDAGADAFQASLTVLLGIATVAVTIAAFSWWLIPLLIAAWLIARRYARPTTGRQTAPPPAA